MALYINASMDFCRNTKCTNLLESVYDWSVALNNKLKLT